MELVLNIYSNDRDEKGERIIEKTYKANSVDLLYAPIEDTLAIMENADLTDESVLTKLVLTGMKQIKPILKDVFIGLTDEELKKARINEIVAVLIGILSEALTGILSNETIKNVIRGLK